MKDARPRHTALFRGALLLSLALVAGCTNSSATEPPSVDGPALTVAALEYVEVDEAAWNRVSEPEGFLGEGALRAGDASPDDADAFAPAVYEVSFPTGGRYYVWVRGFAPERGRDSLHLALDHDWGGRRSPEFGTYDIWSWTETTVHDDRTYLDVPNAGTHTVTVWPRDPGVSIDQLVFVRDPAYVPPLEEAALLWYTDHETGDLSDWDRSSTGLTCGGEYNNDGGSAAVTDAVAHSGRHAVRLLIADVEGDQGTRLFRGRCESRRSDGLYYSAWLYFPHAYRTVDEWWNVWQWKSQAPADEESEPQWILDVRGDGTSMHFRMRDKTSGESVWHDQSNPRPIPTGQWVHVEAFYRSEEDPVGRVVVWQDGVEIFRFHDVRTVQPDGDTRWSVNNYTSSIEPDPAVVYVDDAAITMQRLGPRLPGAAQRTPRRRAGS